LLKKYLSWRNKDGCNEELKPPSIELEVIKKIKKSRKLEKKNNRKN
jgi:hypothetical protein